MPQKQSEGKKTYTLFNIKQEKYLTHPKYGMWTSNSYTECQEMMVFLKEYLDELNLKTVTIDDFKILEL